MGRATFETSLSVTKPFTGRVVVFGAASGDARLTTHDLVFTHQVQVKGLHIGALAVAAPSLYQRCSTRSRPSSPRACTRPAPPRCIR